MVKKLVSILFAIILSFEMIGTITAIDASTYDINGDAKFSTLSISNKTAICVSSYRNLSDNCYSITAVQSLEKRSWLMFWNTVGDKFTKTVTNKSDLSFTNYKYNLDAGTYRVKTVFTVVLKDGRSESVTVYSSEGKVN